MAKDLLWEGDRAINLDDFVPVSQTLVDLFSNSDVVPNFNNVRRHLLTYYSLLQSSHLTNSVLNSLPLPRSLDPNTPATTPGRIFTLLILIRDTVLALPGLPFFLLPLLIHAPVYFMGRMGARMVKDEEETQAQNKVAFGLLSSIVIYPASFLFLWAIFWYTPLGALFAAVIVYLFAVYHTTMIDGNYERAKRFIAAWRVLVGVWTPKRFDLSMGALKQYMTPKIPPPNMWIDANRPKKEEQQQQESKVEEAIHRTTSLTDLKLQLEPPVKSRSARRPPSRRLVRHVLRARVEAVNALASMFDQLDASSARNVKASLHLAKLYGNTVAAADASATGESGGFPAPEEQGYRSLQEILRFLKERGAKIPTLRHGRLEERWAEAPSLSTNSDTEYSTSDEK